MKFKFLVNLLFIVILGVIFPLFSNVISNDPNLENNPYLSEEIKDRIRPYLISFDHPMRPVLDSLFLHKRITVDKKTFQKAGFRIIAKGPRTYVRVAKHREMPGYLVKVILDTILNEKKDKPSWEWFVQRCEGAKKIRNVIKKNKIKHFIAPKKWIYCLPAEPSPPLDSKHRRHFAIVLTTDMGLASKEENLYAWKNGMTEDHLNELYFILSHVVGSSYRPSNLALTKSGKFAFIDTEYPYDGPNYMRIHRHFSEKMQRYWEELVENGGP